jgi:hypothetical protein
MPSLQAWGRILQLPQTETAHGYAGYVTGPWLVCSTRGLVLAGIYGGQTGIFNLTDAAKWYDKRQNEN